MGEPDDQAALAERLQRYLADAGHVANLQVMADGHAGLTFGFDLHRHTGGHTPYILKKAPEGVPRRGSADIYRQAALLRTLHSAGFPAPDVPWAHNDDDALGAPFIIMERLPGRSVIVWDPAPASLAQFADATSMWAGAAALMGMLHSFDWRAQLGDWQAPTTLPAELERWTKLLRHMQDSELRARAITLADQLARSRPEDGPIGLLHGDLQPGNVLYDNGEACGLIDWDLATIGPIGLDVGWLSMIADAEGWAPDWRPHAAPPRDLLLHAYRGAGGGDFPASHWHQAFAFFRMAAITGLNHKLHRDGRRIDPVWERFSAAVPFMLTRGAQLAHSL